MKDLWRWGGRGSQRGDTSPDVFVSITGVVDKVPGRPGEVGLTE